MEQVGDRADRVTGPVHARVSARQAAGRAGRAGGGVAGVVELAGGRQHGQRVQSLGEAARGAGEGVLLLHHVWHRIRGREAQGRRGRP